MNSLIHIWVKLFQHRWLNLLLTRWSFAFVPLWSLLDHVERICRLVSLHPLDRHVGIVLSSVLVSNAYLAFLLQQVHHSPFVLY